MKQRVILCSVDGMRPDAVQAASTPTMDRLVQEGAHTWTARTVMPSSTLPCHTSMLRGVDTPRHGITSNTFQPLVRPVPSLLDVARQQGRTTAAFYNWEQLRDLASPGSLNVAVMHGECTSEASDTYLMDQACAHLKAIDIDLMFFYLGWTDECGHKHGWMSDEYLKAVSHADACLGRVLEIVAALGRAEETTVLVLADHGGHGRSHGTDMDDDILIPWILHGPEIREGHAITGEVRIFDTCVTLAHVLGLNPAREWEGRIITEALAT